MEHACDYWLEDVTFAAQLAASGLSRRRYVCLHGHSRYEPPPPPAEMLRARCLTHGEPRPCPTCRSLAENFRLASSLTEPVPCRRCGAPFQRDHARRRYCPQCRPTRYPDSRSGPSGGRQAVGAASSLARLA